MSGNIAAIADLITTERPVGDDYNSTTISPTNHVTEMDVVSASGLTVMWQAAEMIASTLVMSACIAATIFGNVLVVLSVFTYRTEYFIISAFRSSPALSRGGHSLRSSTTELG